MLPFAVGELTALGGVLVALIGGGGITAILLLKPQRESIIATASESAVRTVAAASAQLGEQLTQARERIAALEQLNTGLSGEVLDLRTRITELEKLLRADAIEARDAVKEAKAAVKGAEVEVQAQKVERARVQERDKQADAS